MPPRVMLPRGRGGPPLSGAGWGMNAPRSRGVGRDDDPLARETRQARLAEQRQARGELPAEFSEGQWDGVQEEAHDEVNQEMPSVQELEAPPVTVENEALLQRMATMIAGAMQIQ